LTYKPPITITPTMLNLVARLQHRLGLLEGLGMAPPRPELRRGYRAMVVQSSCAIEGNSLTLEQVSTILEGKKVLAPAHDVLEITNANRAYEAAATWSPHSSRDFCAAHKIMMAGLIPDAGSYRQGHVGIIRGQKVTHVGPKPQLVPKLMGQLFDYVRASRDIPRAIIASVCHYEIEFIHPFSDGNGRMGRLWQHVILVEGNPLLAQVPFESIIKERQKDYYKALRQSDQAGESTPFVEFSLEALLGALEAIWETYKPAVQRPEDRLQVALRQFGKRWFVRKEYLTCHKGISTATASRDLAAGVEKGLLLVEGEKATARYRFQ
jgi:Fic family protein